MKVYEISKILNELAPYKTAYSFDNVGLLVGDAQQTVSRIMLALDATSEVVAQAAAAKVQLLITHHPIIFNPIKNVTMDTASGQVIMQLVKENISMIAMHTNLDIAQGGVNDCLAEAIGLLNIQTVNEKHSQDFVKLSLFVPSTHTQMIIETLDNMHLKIFANYESCTFTTTGTGRFKPLEGAQPAVGSKQVLCTVVEDKIELLLNKYCVEQVIAAVKSVHPYEQMAYEVLDVLTPNSTQGILRIGELDNPMNASELAAHIKQQLHLEYVLLTSPDKVIRKVAVCGGSGAEFITAACQFGADALLTGELKYHEAQAAEFVGISVFAIGHQESEELIVEYFAERLKPLLISAGVEVLVARQSKTVHCV